MNPISIYRFEQVSEYLRAWAQALPPQQKRGAYNRLAQAAGVFPSYFSQILKGDRNLNSDQAMGMAEYLQLTGAERRYFLRLVDLERAQTDRLKRYLRDELNEIRTKHHQLSEQVPHQKTELSAQDLQTFYSSWIYIAVRLLVAIPGYKKTRVIARHLGVSEEIVDQTLQFLLRTGLCKRSEGGIEVGPTHMHLEHDSPLIQAHHANWRLKAMDRHAFLDSKTELSYSFVTTLSEQDALRIRSLLIDFVRDIRTVTDPSPPEKLFCLGMDWFQI